MEWLPKIPMGSSNPKPSFAGFTSLQIFLKSQVSYLCEIFKEPETLEKGSMMFKKDSGNVQIKKTKAAIAQTKIPLDELNDTLKNHPAEKDRVVQNMGGWRLKPELDGDGETIKFSLRNAGIGEILVRVFLGLSFGLFMGFLLSRSPANVGGDLLSTLVGVLTAYIGLTSESISRIFGEEKVALVIAFFSIGALVAVLVGSFYKDSRFLSYTLKERSQDYQELGIEPKFANDLAVFSELKLVPAGYVTIKADGTNSILLPPAITSAQCEALAPKKFAKKTPGDYLDAFKKQKGPWAVFANLTQNIPLESQSKALQSFRACFCEVSPPSS